MNLSVTLNDDELTEAIGNWLDKKGFVTTDALRIYFEDDSLVVYSGVHMPDLKQDNTITSVDLSDCRVRT